MKTTLFTTILSGAALSAALFASSASAQSCTCQRYAPPAPPVTYVQPPVVYAHPPVVEEYSYDDEYYDSNNTQVIVGYPGGWWDGGYWRGRYLARGWYNERGYVRGYERNYRGDGERFYGRPGGEVRGGGNWGHPGGGNVHGRR